MKNKYVLILISIVLIISWMVYSVNQPKIIVGSSKNWKVVYKPRKGDEADSISYPWAGKIKWRHLFTQSDLQSIDLLIENRYVNMLDKDSSKKGNGNFNGRVVKDIVTFYDGPDKTKKGMRITWKKDGKKHTETFKFERRKRLFVFPLF